MEIKKQPATCTPYHPERPRQLVFGPPQATLAVTLVANTPLMCMSVRRLCVTPEDRKDTLSKFGDICTTATCWWKWEDMACSLRITTELMLFTARRLFREPHFIPCRGRDRSVN